LRKYVTHGEMIGRRGDGVPEILAAAKVFVSGAIKESFCWKGRNGSVEALKLF
jgi:hypothetical protein